MCISELYLKRFNLDDIENAKIEFENNGLVIIL